MILVRVCTRYKGRSQLQENILAVLILATSLKLKKGAPSLSTNTVELANDGHGEHRPSREATEGADCCRGEESFTRNRIGGEVVARGAGSVRGG